MNVHKNARLTPQGRLLLVWRITEEDWTVADAANAAGQSYRWLARYRSGGALRTARLTRSPTCPVFQHRPHRERRQRADI
jgi:hypothetical protein